MVKEHVAQCNQVDKLCTACGQVELMWSRGWARVEGQDFMSSLVMARSQ